MSTIFYVEKDTDLMRSTFIAFGLAQLFYELAPQGSSGVDPIIRDQGSVYTIEVQMTEEAIFQRVQDIGRVPEILPAIKKGLSDKEQKTEGLERRKVEQKYQPMGFTGIVVDYEAERLKESQRYEERKDRQEGEPPKRPAEYPLWAHLCSYFGKGSAMRKGYPLVLHTWHKHNKKAADILMQIILARFATFPNSIEATEQMWRDELLTYLEVEEMDLFEWKKELPYVTGLAVVSPSTVQGAYSLTGAMSLNNEPRDVFWLDLYLALAGYMAVGMPYRAESDVLLYYPLPQEVNFSHAQNLMKEYQADNYAQNLYTYSNAIPRAKIDAICHILYYKSVMRMRRQSLQRTQEAKPWSKTLAVHSIEALVAYYYKDVATQIPFDETAFAAPAWLPYEPDLEQLLRAEQVLQAHYDIIGSIRGNDGEELTIINHYRRFITFGNPDDWVEFSIAYGQFHFSKLLDMGWLPDLYIDVFKETLMNTQTDRKDYRPILENLGFQNITEAIRSCTGRLRYLKEVKKVQTAFHVRHGLGDDLKRRAHNSDQFIEDLSSFIYDYMRESDVVQSHTGEYRQPITEEDLYQIIELVNTYGSRVVANLLVAAGYSRRDSSTTNQ